MIESVSLKKELNEIGFKNLLDSAIFGMAALSPDFRIIELNKTGADLLRFDVYKDVGKSLFDFLMPEKYSTFFGEIKSVLCDPAAEIRKEFEFQTNNGKLIWLDVSIQNQLHNPMVMAIVMNFYDITPLRSQIEYLNGEKERYHILTKATSDTIWDWDIVNDRMQYNSGITDMFGYHQAEIENTENWWQKKIHPDDLNKVKNKINRFLKGSDHQMQFKYRFLCCDGTYKYIYDRAFLIFDSVNTPIRMIGAMQDVTEFRNSMLAIRRQNLKLKKIAWTQSHVVRAPLARIIGLVNLLKSNPSEEILDHLSTVSKELDGVLREIVKEAE